VRAGRPEAVTGIERILRMSGAGPWVLYGLFAVTHVTLAVLSGGQPMATAWGWAGLATILAAAAWSVWPGPFPLPLRWTAAILALLVFGTTAITWHLDPATWPGYASWNFGAVTFTCFALSLRGRTWAGWVGVGTMTVSATAWSLATAGDPWIGFGLSYRHLGTFLAGSLLALGVHGAARRIEQYRAVEHRTAADAAALAAGRSERAAELESVRDLAGPALRRIADGRIRGGGEEFRRIEAALRDRIRGRRLTLPPLGRSIDAARQRGVEVDVLDDVGAIPIEPAMLGPALEHAAGLLDGWEPVNGPVTLRLALHESRPVLTMASREGRSSALPVG
jgi:hypothetical protein